jgi:hypothetical protein
VPISSTRVELPVPWKPNRCVGPSSAGSDELGAIVGVPLVKANWMMSGVGAALPAVHPSTVTLSFAASIALRRSQPAPPSVCWETVIMAAWAGAASASAARAASPARAKSIRATCRP